jgi:hypothetical protein
MVERFVLNGVLLLLMPDIPEPLGPRSNWSQYWSFFTTIDEDLHELSRFIEFHPENLKTFSVHLLRLYLAIGSEVDVVAKLLCLEIDPAQKPDKITEYRPIITGKYTKLEDLNIHVRGTALTFTPWRGWNSGTIPTWWESYNGVKHRRHVRYPDANLENVLSAAAGLLVLLVYLCKDELFEKDGSKPHVRPDFHVFALDDRYVGGPMFWGYSYNFPDLAPNKPQASPLQTP